MSRTYLLLLPLVAILLVSCGAAEATIAPPRPNPDGRTYYCSTCAADVSWPPDGHRHGETAYCDECRTRVPAEGHLHRENRWCDVCERPAVWTDETDRWEGRGHYHGKTRWCPVCKTDRSTVDSSEPGGHHHQQTIYCSDEACQMEVSRRMAPDGTGPADPAEIAEDHIHGKTVFCTVCGVEAERDPARGLPSKNHFHHITRFDKTCGLESAIGLGHDHDLTRFCPVCQAEIPIDPGVPTGSVQVGTVLSSAPGSGQLSAEAHAAITAEIGEQQKVSADLKAALEATEAKLGLDPQKLVHDHSAKLVEVSGSQSGSDPLSRFRDYKETGERKPSIEEENIALRTQFEEIITPSKETIIRHAINRLEKIQVRDEKEDEELDFWKRKLDKLVEEAQ